MISFLNPNKALIFRITHIANMPWILDNGLHARSSSSSDVNFRSIGNPDLIDKRAHRRVEIPPGGTLADYIPFYFTPYSPMLYNIKTGYSGVKIRPMADIVIMVASLRKVRESGQPFLFTDRHAYLEFAEYFSDLEKLSMLDWPILQRRDFKRDYSDLEKFERYQAEALIYKHLPVSQLSGIVCNSPAAKTQLDEAIAKRALELKSFAKPDWFF